MKKQIATMLKNLTGEDFYVNEPCDNPRCKHQDCVFEKSSGKYYKKSAYEFTESEAQLVIQMYTLKKINAIYNIVVGLIAIGVILGVIMAVV